MLARKRLFASDAVFSCSLTSTSWACSRAASIAGATWTANRERRRISSDVKRWRSLN
jgi:hypothetical protein